MVHLGYFLKLKNKVNDMGNNNIESIKIWIVSKQI